MIYCFYCDLQKEDKWFDEEMLEFARILRLIQKDTPPKLACRKCRGYRVRSRKRKAGINYQN